jgi:VCBS repeat-containing protein
MAEVVVSPHPRRSAVHAAWRAFCTAGLFGLLTACGIVDSGGSQGIDVRPGDRTVNEQARVVLDAATLVEDPANKTFFWEQTSGPDVSLTGQDTARASFVAPAVDRRTVLVFTLTVTDQFGNAVPSDVRITINDAPTANAGRDQRVPAGAQVTLNGRASTDDTGIARFRWAQTGGTPVSLTGADTATPSFTVPASTQGGEAFSFRLTVIDDDGARDTDDVSLTVNRPPVANAGPDQRVTSGNTVTLNGAASTDPENRPLSFQWQQTAGPTVTLNGANTATPSFVAPNVTVMTRLVFALTVTDDLGATASDTVIVTVLPPNVPPVAVNDGPFIVAEGGTLTIPAPGVLVNDTDANGDQLSARLVSDPRNGTITLNPDGSFTYVHNGGEAVSDSFTYRASDGINVSNAATVTFSITPVNDAPVAVNDAFDVDEGGSVTANVLANDRDPDGDDLTPILVSPPVNGTLAGPGPLGNFIYQHNGSETIRDSFTYRVQDPSGALSNVATVSFTINPVNDGPPTANPDSGSISSANLTTTINVIANDTDPDGAVDIDPASINIPNPPQFGTAQANPDGTITYTQTTPDPAGAPQPDSFSYTVADRAGARSGAPAGVSISVAPAATVANACWTGSSGATVAGVLEEAAGLRGPLRYRLLKNGVKGRAAILNPSTGAFAYTPLGIEASGSDTFTYQVRDAQGQTRYGEVTVIIEPRLMPLGDGVTAGIVDGTRQLPVPEMRVGYRKALQQQLTAAGYQIDFVGGQAYGASVTGFDYQTEAHAGHSAAELAQGSKLKDLSYPDSGIYAWLEANPADFVLLHLSPPKLKTARVSAVAAILDEIDRYEQDYQTQVRVLLARVLDRKPSDPRITAYNDRIEAMAKARTTDPSHPAYPDRVKVVDQQAALSPADLHDGRHPTPRGYTKMANTWFKAIRAICQPSADLK